MLAFVRANKLNRIITSGGRDPKIGIINVRAKAILTSGRPSTNCGIDEIRCNALLVSSAVQGRLRLASSAERELKEFVSKASTSLSWSRRNRSLLEVQVREELYGTANQPIGIGKKA